MLNKKYIFSAFIGISLLFIVPVSVKGGAREASLFLLPDKTTYLDPEYLTLDIVVNTNGLPINAAQISLSFPVDKLQIVNSSLENSWCDIVVNESFNNTKGIYNLICGSPLPRTSSLLPTTQLTFTKLTSGWAQFKFNDNTSVRLHDGQGADALGDREIHNIYLIK